MAKLHCGSLYFRYSDTLLPEGFVVEGHKHPFDHPTIFTMGTWKVETFGEVYNRKGVLQYHKVIKPIPVRINQENGQPVFEEKEIEEPLTVKIDEVTILGGYPKCFIKIAADKIHKLTLMKGWGTYMCAYPHRTPDGEIVEEYTGWGPGYGTSMELLPEQFVLTPERLKRAFAEG